MVEPYASAGVGDDGALSVGARVQLHSLQRTPEHNGAEGEVVEFDASTGRWRVRLAGPDGRELALKASNLAVLAPAPQVPAPVGQMSGADVEIYSEDIDAEAEELQEALTLSMETAAAESGGSVALPATNDAEANIRRRWVTYRMHKRERERETSTGLCSSAVPRRRDREWPSA